MVRCRRGEAVRSGGSRILASALLVASREFRLEFLQPCFHRIGAGPFFVGEGLLVLEGGDGPAGGWVVPAQLPAFPANEEVQRGTVPSGLTASALA